MNRIKPCICSGIRRYCKTCGENQALYLYKSRYWREGIKPCACTNAGTGERESSPVLLQTQVLEGPVKRIKPCPAHSCTNTGTGRRESSPVLVQKQVPETENPALYLCTNADTGTMESSPVLVQKQVLEGLNQALYLYKNRYWRDLWKESSPVLSQIVPPVTDAGTCVAVR